MIAQTKDKSLVNNDKESNNIINFPIDINNIDISWMNQTQKRIFDVIKIKENRSISFTEISLLAGYTGERPINAWYRATKDEKFADLVEQLGINIRTRNRNHASHNEVKYIIEPKEREKHINGDIWDTRMLFKDYPRHCAPVNFIVYFDKIRNVHIRKIVKRYFKNMLSSWQPATFSNYLSKLCYFLDSMYELFPNMNSFKDLERDKHIEPIIQNLTCSAYLKSRSLYCVRSMFKYMYYNKWDDAPNSEALIINYDIPRESKSDPRPIPVNIKIMLDDYLKNVIIPLLEKNESTPIIKPEYWDLMLIIRYTGRRFEDMAHLISDESDRDCLQYDLDGDPQLYLDHRIAKIQKDLKIPLAHFKDSKGNNIVEQAILRQKERVKDLPAAPDGYKYLFREVKVIQNGKVVLDEYNNPLIEAIGYNKFNDNALKHVCNNIPLKNNDGSIYKISAHQFRHTVATEMIDANVDIYAVKEFLGHSSVAMTEKYIKVYQQRLKKEFKDKLVQSDATDIKNSLSEQEVLYDNKWVKNKIIGVFELGDGCCEHPYKMPSCPHMACKTCFKKKIYPRHIEAVKHTIESETIHRDNASSMGLIDKANEFDKVVQLYTVALEIISKGEVFEAAKHFYK